MTIVCLALLLSDPVQRLVIAPWIRLRPSRRIPVLGGWIRLMAFFITKPVQAIGGGGLPKPLKTVPSGPGVLILMNHQSLFDIPLVVQAVCGGYPRIVTRRRYSRWIPLISQMIRLYQYPVVDPTASAGTLRRTFAELRETAKDSDVPIAIFPEGTRTKDGQIARFKSAGLARILSARPWSVYVLVTDGLWQIAKFEDLVKGMSHIDGKLEHVGTLEWTDPEADPAPFIEEVRTLMIESLAAMRGEAAVA